jgi:hypothetical protein
MLAGALALAVGAATADGRPAQSAPLEIRKIYWEYNSSANDLGVHVSLDGEDWKRVKIVNPKNKVIFDVEGKQAYRSLGMTELFFEGAEPNLGEFPLEDLLALFPEGDYEFVGRYVDGVEVEDSVPFSHAVPDGPVVSSVVGPGNSVVIGWTAFTSVPAGFPQKPLSIVGYQVVIGSDALLVTVPADTLSLTIPPEFVAGLPSGETPYEVLAIDASGNQTLREGTFVKP